MKDKKRGVSPVVATVILISMVIVIALILFLWFRGLTDESITKFDGQNVKLLCESVSFTASYSAGNIYVSNDGTIPIYNLKVKASGGGKSELIDGIQQWPDYGLNPGRAMSSPIDVGSWDKITLIPVLIGTTERGQKTYECDERKYGRGIEING
jgi:flagellin-like protein